MTITLQEKINQLFILGYQGEDFTICKNFSKLLEENLGGVIFFTQNIIEENQFREQIKKIKNSCKTQPFLSIDEEGGRVERFENINRDYPNCKKYKSAQYIAEIGEKALIEQTEKISAELNSYGINMNFAPVLDVNSNPNNPIIGERAYSNSPSEVAKYALLSDKIYRKNKIITVGKHFPGHGDTKKDSHIEMPVVDLNFKEFKNTHLYPFKIAIKENIPAIMVAHVHYKCFDDVPIPASLSKNVLNYLRQTLNYNGLIISDDMRMGGVNSILPIDAITKALQNGVNCFIYRDSSDDIIKTISTLYELSKNNN